MLCGALQTQAVGAQAAGSLPPGANSKMTPLAPATVEYAHRGRLRGLPGTSRYLTAVAPIEMTGACWRCRSRAPIDENGWVLARYRCLAHPHPSLHLPLGPRLP